ncbi:hypothetical protein LguiB_020591 [Lonicera macranthoides]
MKELAKAYFEEAKWYNEGYVPTLEEYMKIDVCVLTQRGTCRYARKPARAFSELMPQTSFSELWMSLTNHSVRVGIGSMGDCLQLCQSHKTALNFIKCIPTALNAP